jgi:cysteine-rich repeat protein
VLTSNEACDDGNITSGDGCSADCKTVEPGWRCLVPGMRCIPLCGDRVLMGTENCDDGNALDGDGCSSFCLTETGWDCSSGICELVAQGDGGQDADDETLRCGDGIVSGAEECDDGPDNDDTKYGGCTTHCRNICCGDGIVNGSEACDLGPENGQILGKDGCCTLACTTPHYCGDNILDTDRGEQCGDLGPLNGVTLDSEARPSDAPEAAVLCTMECKISFLPM